MIFFNKLIEKTMQKQTFAHYNLQTQDNVHIPFSIEKE